MGGDKPLSYFPINEDNALLGWRGIRISLDQPDIFLTQLRAAMRAAEGLGNLRIMLPMISGADELDEALGHIQQTYRSLNEAGLGVDMPPVGLLIEVPSAVYQAASLAARVDFLSIGTNDLTQYLLAVDRNNERVGALYDSLHPAVIRAVLAVVEAGKQAGRPVGVCGEAAGDPAAALLLLGIGVDNLSASPGNLPRVKQVVRSFTRTQAQQLLAEALELDRTSAVRGLMTQALDDAGLGRLVRGGA